MHKSLRLPILLGLFLAGLLAVAAGQTQSTQPTTSGISPSQNGSAAASGLQQHDPRYVIKTLDVLNLSFPLSPELDQTVTVQPDGYINLKSASSLHVAGFTVPQVSATVAAAYAGILRDPVVTVDLKDFQKPQYTVSGQVTKPGQYELRPDITVTEAIAVAGGLASTSTSHAFLFRRIESGGYNVQRIDLKPLLSGKSWRETAMVRPGDVILVPENNITKFRKYVPYSVGATYLPTGNF